jgi:hypothetical protein
VARVYNPDLFRANNISEAVNNKCKLLSTPFRVNERGNFYLVDGEEIPQKEYENRFPTNLVKTNLKGENTNKRRP